MGMGGWRTGKGVRTCQLDEDSAHKQRKAKPPDVRFAFQLLRIHGQLVYKAGTEGQVTDEFFKHIFIFNCHKHLTIK